MPIVPLMIDGEDVSDAETTMFAANPRRAALSGWTVQGATPEHCVRAVASCQAAWPAWRATTAMERAILFERLVEVLRARHDELVALVVEEIDTTPLWAGIIVGDTIDIAVQMASLLRAGAVTTATVPQVRNRSALAVVSPRPLGVVLGIAPWNAPTILGLRAVAAPVAAGNCCVLKGSELSPRTHYAVASAFREAGFPRGVVNFVVHRQCDAVNVFETLIAHPAVRKCNFTGSTAVGRAIAVRAAHHLKPVLLELGGKNVALVLDDADLADAADKILFGAFLNSGQICMSTDLVFVSAQHKNTLCQRLCERLVAVAADQVRDIINNHSCQRITALVDNAVAKGATLMHADPIRLQGGALLLDVTPEMDFWTQESFGPVVGVTTYDTPADAVVAINESQYGLSASIFTGGSQLAALELAAQLNVGAVHVNGPTVHDEVVLPHGGVKNSGYGRFGATWGLQEFLQTQTVILNP